MKTSFSIFLAAIVGHGVLLTQSTQGQTVKRIAQPEGVFYYQPAASVFGSEAVWVNPAGLGRFNSSSMQVMADYFDGDVARSWGWVVQADRLSTAFRYLDDQFGGNFKEWVFAGGMPVGGMFNLGLSYRYFPDGPGSYDGQHNWTIGAQGNTRGVISWAAVYSNLNRSKVNGERTETEQRYSLAYRTWQDRLTLAVDAFLSTKTQFNNADFVYHAELSPRAGLYVNGFVDSDRGWQIGLRVNILRQFAGFKSRFSRGGDGRGTTAFIGTTHLMQPSLITRPQRPLAISLAGELPENPPRPVFGRSTIPFISLVRTLYRAADDPSVSALQVSVGPYAGGFAKTQEIREALQRARQKGKRVICHLSEPGNLSYYLACAADSILISPVSRLNLVGLRTELTFYGGTLEKLGARIDMVRIGDYKSAAEIYTRSAATEENREQVNRLLDDVYDQFVAGIAQGRGLSEDSVRSIIDHGPFTSVDALTAGLVDGLCYPDEFKSAAGSKARMQSLGQYMADTVMSDRWEKQPSLAVVVAEGEITSDGGDISPFGRAGDVTPTPMRQALEQAVADSRVKGIILRVDSPGGSALASDEILHSIAKAATKKPLVVSMGNVAASGGYYVALSGRHLFADHGTITGSVGIYGGKADLSGLYQKIALGKELYTRGRFAGMMSTVRPFTDEERSKYYSQLKAFYDHFVSLVAENRSLPSDSVDKLGQGRVWSGSEALSAGLIDEIGGIKKAADFLNERLGLGDAYTVEVYPRRRPLVMLPAAPLVGAVVRVFTGRNPVEQLADIADLPAEGMLLARLPFDITIE
ncbi:MAG: signal peptide peptidase SppA [Candidatus Zixiibacteriota bacterium]